jgi:protein-S-isoprenylcysteine O-methyltransferase Ste14
MLTLLRHLLSILLLPFMVVVVVPNWLLTRYAASDSRWLDGSAVIWLTRSAGAVFGLAGLGLFGWCVGLFAKVGQGTLAPWDPTRKLVAVGPYRFMRNPMISGVALLLIGQALLRGSWAIGIWAGVFVLINHIYFVLLEEPGLEQRFGEPYRVYKAKVPRWIPRLKSGASEN